MSTSRAQGFTLLELLIVIAIIAILATVIVIVINPVEMLRRARDVQRLSDLSSLKTAIAMYLVGTPTPSFTGGGNNNRCASVGVWSSGDEVFYSYTGTLTTGGNPIYVIPSTGTNIEARHSSTPTDISGGGWIPVDLGSLSGSSPLSHLPLDPSNTIADVNNIAYTDQVYRFACRTDPLAFELNTRLESTLYTSEDNKMQNDGGDNDELYETGTRLDILKHSATTRY